MHLASQSVLIALSLALADAATFDWDTKPSRNLEYHDCYDGYQCARLEVPLDWTNNTDTRTAVIAIAKLPAVVSDDDPSFGGSIFVNPGGPGASGVSFVLSDGHDLQQYVDKPGRRHYEIFSWDPRGIGRTTPSSNCFRSDIVSRSAWQLEARGNGGLDKGIDSIKYGLAMSKALSQRCKDSEKQWGDAMAFVNTPSVARDMVEMVDKVDELRKREGYIGFSYGTALGNYFASLYPGRVGRMVLDGVVHADDYANGPGWLTNLHDTDEILEEFWRGCHQAGPSICTLASDSDASPSEIKTRFWSWVADLDDIPIPALSSSGTIVVITGDDIRKLVGSSLYNPIRTFKLLATTLREAMKGNTTELVSNLMKFGHVPNLDTVCSDNNSTKPAAILPESQSAVICGDGDDITDKDAGWWSNCSSWPFRPNLSFKGPFTTPKAHPNLVAGHPAAPLLFLSPRLDPVTPLNSARAMAANHPGAAVVVQGSMGHCVIGTAPSDCTKSIVADYFESGTVPSEEVTCKTQCGPWDDNCSGYSPAAASTGESASWQLQGNPLLFRQ
ncbi:TAP-like protein domain-containing protein [Trichoderma breve]|uniref:TAP-like protein domain-containing protein n=1 Tax=Trichoderma breve TaxID=2034170 RepID=A0A9W9B894_9HYPO|nr:TAP-like protein domain-containing protein [Trichoderma breve]KAJ4855600.1 TAP-like protein domain-containing protein [Trichoderma breve]